jgi:hypothetical protein
MSADRIAGRARGARRPGDANPLRVVQYSRLSIIRGNGGENWRG